ncbi:hypothetical protein Q5752_003012 [Cryptotrichosporon argae]
MPSVDLASPLRAAADAAMLGAHYVHLAMRDNTTAAEAEAIVSAATGEWLAPLMLGMFADAMLWGALFSIFIQWQTYVAANERPIVRTLVYYCVGLETIVTGFMCAWVMTRFAYGFGDFLAVYTSTSWRSWSILFISLSRTPVSLFFTERAFRISGRSWFFLVAISFLTLASFGGAIASKILTERDNDPNVLYAILVWIVCEVASDVLITATILFYLLRSRTGWNRTDKVIARLAALAIETQFPPMLIAIVVLIVNFENKLFLTFFACTPKVYAIGLLVALCARVALRRELDNGSGKVSASVYQTETKQFRTRRIEPEIYVTTETYVHAEHVAVDDPDAARARPKFAKVDTDGPVSRKYDDDDETAGTFADSQARLVGPSPAQILLA